MSHNSSATIHSRAVVSARTSTGIWWGLLGVLAFSFTVPFTRVAVDGMSPLFIGAGRAVVAALLAALALGFTGQRLPRASQWVRLAVVAGGVVAGFPLLTTFALTSTSASHGAVVIALLPAATATAAVIRGRERPRPLFWVLTLTGVVAALVFALVQSGGFGSLHWADLLLLAAVLAAAVGYAEGGLLARELGSWQTISWGLVVASPVMIALTVVSLSSGLPSASGAQWLSFAYLGVVSMFLGFFAWYRGLAIGPMAQVSQIQLVQPVMTIAWAGLLLGESITWTTVVGGLAVIICAGAAVRVRLNPPSNS
ncbi:DMT family transporter [Paenarthrobacter ilicis]|uniref:Drug/metabolite transporter (DMT)-like permease n=1 Tax=Paenarthrobacter ilicis TaxID=43665 RepID=A0ABX0TGQ0_9MICC|nr:DMT family transporter [Paenarthrobacter ilicis]MBM7791691.1 drug/metabolite transporter (DMT)-like permease [Paenarthrobacter ilicis]NIJ01684.1 drug/metabolite transporter (DMT)-like permease [Paenarthrobacter ilicis]